MKVKSLLLAGLAAFAMASCSNNDEVIDNNGNSGEKTSQMQFGIEFPKSTETRAEAGTEAGTVAEYEFSRIAVVLFTNGNKSVLTFGRTDFEDKSVAGSNNRLFLKKSISVEAGASSLYAFVNPTDALMGSLNSAANANALLMLTENAGYGDIDALEGDNKIAKEQGFLMSNAGGVAKTQTFGANASTDVTIQVDRVAAKMEEKSQTTAFDVTGETSKPAPDATLKITLGQYTFTNLATTTSVLYNENYTTAGYFQKVGDFGTTTWTDFSSKNITGVNDKAIGDITYIMENIGGNAIPTRIMYEASASWNGQPAKTFYILADGKVYLSFDELQANVNISGLTENSTVAEFAAKGIKKYVDGKCYYSVDIKTNGTESKIVRNNVYKLKVSSIAKLGTTTPTPDPTPTSINLTVDMKPWTVNTQEDIELK